MALLRAALTPLAHAFWRRVQPRCRAANEAQRPHAALHNMMHPTANFGKAGMWHTTMRRSNAPALAALALRKDPSYVEAEAFAQKALERVPSLALSIAIIDASPQIILSRFAHWHLIRRLSYGKHKI